MKSPLAFLLLAGGLNWKWFPLGVGGALLFLSGTVMYLCGNRNSFIWGLILAFAGWVGGLIGLVRWLSVVLLLAGTLVAQSKVTPCDIPNAIIKQVIVNGLKDVGCGSWVLAFTAEVEMTGDAYDGDWQVVASTSENVGFPKRTYHLAISNSGDMGSGWDETRLVYILTGYDEKAADYKARHPQCTKFPCKWKEKDCEGTDYSISWGMATCNFGGLILEESK